MSYKKLVNLKNVILLYIILGFLIFGNSLFNGFVGDDFDQIINNVLVHSLGNIPRLFFGSSFGTGNINQLSGIYYRPLMTSVFTLVYAIFGSNAFFFHGLQLVIHIINTILVFLFFTFFFEETFAFLISVIFLLHPINTEAVVYISGLDDVLFFFFGMIAIRTVQNQTRDKQVKYGNLIIFLALLCSLLSKETGILFIFTYIIFSILFNKANIKKSIVISGVVVGIYSLLRLIALGLPTLGIRLYPYMRAPLLIRIINIPAITWFYIKTFFFPYNLITAQNWIIKSLSFYNFYLPLIIVFVFFLMIFAFNLFIKKTNKKDFHIFLFFSVWFIIGLALHLQIFPLDSTVTDRWFYFPIVGLLGMIVTGIRTLNVTKKNIKFAAFLGISAFIVLLSIRSFIRTFDWRNNYVLASHDLPLSSGNFILENVLGDELYNRGLYAQAKIHFENSVKITPYYGLALNNIGAVYRNEKDYSKAKEYFQRANAIGDQYFSFINLANTLLYDYKDPKAAQIYIKSALKKLPSNGTLWYLLGLSDYLVGNKDEALYAARQSCILEPTQEHCKFYNGIVQNVQINIQL